MNTDALERATPKLAIAAAVAGALHDAPHLLFDSDYAVASDHPLYVFHAFAGMAMVALLVVVLVGLLLQVSRRADGVLPAVAGAVTLTGLLFVAGGIWGEGFMIPYLADIEPSVFEGEVGGLLLAVLVLGALVFGVGWALMAVVLRRAGLVTGAMAALLGIGAVISMVPLPLTTWVFTVALAVAARTSVAGHRVQSAARGVQPAAGGVR